MRENNSAAAQAGFVTWRFIDGTPMVGTIIDPQNVPGFDSAFVQRIDGTRCYVQRSKLRPSTDEDFAAALDFFTRK